MKITSIRLGTLKEILRWKAHPHRPAKGNFRFAVSEDGTKKLTVVLKPRDVYRAQLRQWVYNQITSYQSINCLMEIDISEIAHWNSFLNNKQESMGVAA